MMFEVCRSLALNKTREFVLLVWYKLIWEKAITKKRIHSNTYERNQNKDVIIIINTRTKKQKFSPFNNYFIIRENKNSKQKMGGI